MSLLQFFIYRCKSLILLCNRLGIKLLKILSQQLKGNTSNTTIYKISTYLDTVLFFIVKLFNGYLLLTTAVLFIYLSVLNMLYVACMCISLDISAIAYAH